MEFLDQKRILCVDDSQDNCELLMFILSDAGYQVEIAYSVMEGLQIAQSGSFLLYLIDLSFADGTGFDLITRIREFDSSTPVVVCSGNVRESAHEAARQAGVRAFLLKPIDPEVLVQVISEVLGDRKAFLHP